MKLWDLIVLKVFQITIVYTAGLFIAILILFFSEFATRRWFSLEFENLMTVIIFGAISAGSIKQWFIERKNV